LKDKANIHYVYGFGIIVPFIYTPSKLFKKKLTSHLYSIKVQNTNVKLLSTELNPPTSVSILLSLSRDI